MIQVQRERKKEKKPQENQETKKERDQRRRGQSRLSFMTGEEINYDLHVRTDDQHL